MEDKMSPLDIVVFMVQCPCCDDFNRMTIPALVLKQLLDFGIIQVSKFSKADYDAMRKRARKEIHGDSSPANLDSKTIDDIMGNITDMLKEK